MAQVVDLVYKNNAIVKCSNCGSVYTVGSTIPEITIEVCGNCHPFYTGNDTVLDTTGRIEKFQARMAKAKAVGSNTGTAKKKKVRKVLQTLSDLDEREKEERENLKKQKGNKEKEVDSKSEELKEKDNRPKVVKQREAEISEHLTVIKDDEAKAEPGVETKIEDKKEEA